MGNPVQLMIIEFAPAMGVSYGEMKNAVGAALHQVGQKIEDPENFSYFGLTPGEKAEALEIDITDMQPSPLLAALRDAVGAVGSSHERPIENAIVEKLKTTLMQSSLFQVELSLLMSHEIDQYHRCTHCGQITHRSGFYNSSSGGGIRQPCKVCYREAQRVRDRRAAAIRKHQKDLYTLLVHIKGEGAA